MAKRIVDEEMRFSIVVNGNEAQAELYKLEKSTRDFTQRNKELKAELTRLEGQGKKNTAEYKTLNAELKQNNATIKGNKAQMEVLQKQLGVTALTMSQLRREASRLRLQLNNTVPGSAQYKKLEADLQAVNTRMTQLRVGAQATEGSLSRLAGGFNKYQALAFGFIASLTGVVLSLQKIIDYNGKLSDSQADVMKTTGLTKKEVDALTKSFGAFNTRTSRIELLELAEEAGRLGIEGSANIKAFTEQANKMKVALGDDLSTEQIREVGKMVNIYKVGEATSKDFAGAMDALGSAINEVSASGANQAGFLVEYLKRQAGIAAQTKLSAADNVGYAATFDEVGQSVEVSATAMNKVFIDMFKNTAEYAKIAGMGLEDFEKLLAEDANEAMIKFLEGLNGNNEGLGVMVKKMEELDAGGTRGVQALAALASNTDLLRKRQELANKATMEATSLTDEYNIKNNNLAAIIEKITKRFQAMVSSQAVTTFLTGLTLIVGKLVGAIQDVNKEFEKETKLSYETAVASRKLANESQVLLERYEALTKDGVVPTTEAKEELDIITLQLRDRLGESVMAINAETGAYELNTEAVRKQIKMKRLAADEEAATMASRLVGVKEEQKELAIRQREAQKEFDLRKKYFDETSGAEAKRIQDTRSLSQLERINLIERLEGNAELEKARTKLGSVNLAIEEQMKREIDLTKKLKDLNFSPEDAQNLIAPDSDAPIVPPIVPPTFTPIDDDKKAAEERKKLIDQINKDILASERAAQDAKIDLLEDAYLEELAKMKLAHDRKMDVLRSQILTETELQALPFELRQKYAERNEALNAQIEAETETHQFKQAALIQKGLAQQFKEQESLYQREKTLRQTKFAEEMAAYAGNEQAQKELRELHQKEELEAEAKHLEELVRQFNQIMAEGEFGGFDLEVLTPAQRDEIQKMLDDIKLKLEEVKAAKRAVGEPEGDGSLDLGTGGTIDIFGFTAQDWVDTFTNLETVEGKIEAASMAVQGFMNAWAMYHEYVSSQENKHLKEFEKGQNKEKTTLKNRLDSGLINQRQYDKAVGALEDEMDKRKADLEYKQAKRAWQMQLTNAMAGAAMATINGFNSQPFMPVGLIMGAIAATLGTIQVGIIAKNKPVKGYEEGYYPDGLFPVEREQDGKIFNTRYGGKPKSGMVNDPTILVGEMPELIISNPDLKKFNPEVTASVMNEIRRVRGYEDGYVSPAVAATPAPEQATDNTALMELVKENTEVLRSLKENGLSAYLVRDMENAKKIQDDLERLKKYKQKAEI